MPPQPLGPRGRNTVKSVTAVAFSAFLAIFANLVLELLQTGGNASRLVEHTLGAAGALTLLGSLVIWVIIALLWAVTGRLSWATFLTLGAVVVIGYANYLKITIRREPLYPSDVDFLSSPGFLTQMADRSSLVIAAAFIACLAVIVAVSTRILLRIFPRVERRTDRRLWGWTIAARVAVGAVAVSGLTYAQNFNQDDNRLRGAYEANGAHWAFWFQRLNYYQNGFVGGVLYNMGVPAMAEPAGYSRSKMQEIVDKYVDRAQQVNSGLDEPPSAGGVAPNVVIVLSEAFSDPSKLEGVEYEEDPIPRTRQLMRKTTSGDMLAQLFGGGTANMEFEALTGMSLSQFAPQLNTPYQMLVPEHESFPSAVGYFKSHGYRAVAIHPYMKSMYKRESVYPRLGFDEFVGENDLPTADKLDRSEFISDQSAFDETVRQISASADPVLVNLVTMQNHVPMEDTYRDPLTVRGVPGELRKQAGNYGRGLAHTDQALDDFLQHLRTAAEPTIVIFYGDHLPAIWPERVHKVNGDRTMRETPFLIWTSSPTEAQETARVTSPIYFLPLAARQAGLQIPPYFALLLDLYEAVPAMEQGEYFDTAGHRLTADELSPAGTALLEDYRLVQYDLAVGRRFSMAGLFYPDGPHATARQ